MNAELGWLKPPPAWVSEMCPEVVDHFDRFPNIRDLILVNDTYMPWFTTNYHARAVCTVKILQAIAYAIGIDVLLYAGTHIGALVHGQPIP